MAVQLSELAKYVQQARDARSPLDIKFSDGQTRTIHMDGSWIGAPIAGMPDPTGNRSINSTIDDFISQQKAAAQPAPQPAATPIAQPAPQPSSPRDIAPPPVQQTTPINQVSTPAAPFALQGGNPSLFSNIDKNTGLPIVSQAAIDAELKKTGTNELTANNSNIRDAIYGSGWNAKSDAIKVLNGAAVYGLVKTPSMGGFKYQSDSGKALTDTDFVNAAKAAGVDPTPYYSQQIVGMGNKQNVLDKNALYNAINDKSKDLYLITNTIDNAARGDAAPHATILFKSDGQGNLVPQFNQQTGQPAVQYSSATRYASDPGIMGDLAPFLMLAPAVGGILGSAGIFGPGTIGAGLEGSAWGAANAANGLGTAAAGTLAPDVAALIGAGTGAAALPLNQVGALTSASTPAQVAAMPTVGDVVGGGAGAMGIGALASGAGGTAAQQALANAFSNNALYNALGAGAGALASYLGASGQADAAKQAAANQMSMFNTINNQLAPQRGAGYESLNQIRSMLPGQYTTYGETGQPTGTAQGSDYFTRQFSPQDLYAGLAPNYNFMLQQGQNLKQRQANLAGGAIGGNALQGLENYTQDYAGNAYQQAFNNFNTQRTGIYNTLAGIAGIGQNATNTTANAGQAATTAAGQLGVGAAGAQAAGLQGIANAATGGLQNYQQNQILQAILAQNQNVAQKPV